MADDDFIYLTTTGRRTKRPHRIEIWYARAGDRFYLLAGGGRQSDWVRNLDVEPRCTLTIGRQGAELAAHGRALEPGDPDESTARDLVFEKYRSRYSGDLTRWRGEALPVALDLEPHDRNPQTGGT